MRVNRSEFPTKVYILTAYCQGNVSHILPDLPHDYNCDHQNYTRVLFYLKMLNNSRKYLHMLINWCIVKQLVHQVVITLYICYICCFSVAGPKGGLRGLHPPPPLKMGEKGKKEKKKKERREGKREEGGEK